MEIIVNVLYKVKLKKGLLLKNTEVKHLTTRVKSGTLVDNEFLDDVARKHVDKYIDGTAQLVSIVTRKDTTDDELISEVLDKISNTVEPIDIPEAPNVNKVSNELEDHEEQFAKKYLGNWIVKELKNPKTLLTRSIKVAPDEETLWRLLEHYGYLLEHKGYGVFNQNMELQDRSYDIKHHSPVNYYLVSWGKTTQELMAERVPQGVVRGSLS